MPRTRQVSANGLRFAVQEEGEGDRLALCLHGFPELAHSWRHQLPMLAELGYRAWAPDLRGYGGTDRPRRLADYAIERLMEDVSGLIRAAGRDRAVLIAHDWGGFIAWHFAMRRPEQVERLIILNMPHPKPFLRELRGWAQLKRSWYVLFFQLPWLPERFLGADHSRRVASAFRSMAVHRDRFSHEELMIYRDAASKPGALTAMLNYYRAFLRGGGAVRQLRKGFPTIDVPTLMIWGEKDTALGLSTVQGTEEVVSELTLRTIPDASHWVQQEVPEVVNPMIAAWLRGQEVPQAEDLPRDSHG